MYYANGDLCCEGEFSNGMVHGHATVYDENGNILYKGYLENNYIPGTEPSKKQQTIQPVRKKQQMRPEDLPPGVTTSRGVDMRSICYEFTHEWMGKLGKKVIMDAAHNKTMIHAELFTDKDDPTNPKYLHKKELFEKVVKAISQALDYNFPD